MNTLQQETAVETNSKKDGSCSSGRAQNEQDVRHRCALSTSAPGAEGSLGWIKKPRNARAINCDQVAWMLASIDRYLPRNEHPAISRARHMQKFGLLYELMESANLYFEDAAAQHNGTPQDVRWFGPDSKSGEQA